MNNATQIPPPQSLTASPDLCVLDEYTFQLLCSDLWSQECRAAYVYGRRGQKQFGIDIFAYGCQATGNGTGQCKKYAECTVDHFKDAVAEFEKELDRWQRRNVKQFRLFVACPCADTRVLDEVYSTTERILEKGIEFEFFDGHRIIAQLRHYPELVSQYIGVHWVDVLCGGRGGSILIGKGRGNVLSALGLSDFVVAEWQSDRSRDLDKIRERFRCGHVFDAYNHLRAFIKSPAWSSLSGNVRALALRILASMELNRCGDVDAAMSWIEAARKADPCGNFQIIDALIAYHQLGVDAAIKTLGSPQKVDAWNFLLSLRLAKGESAAVLAEFDAKPFELNSESLRLRALALLLQKRVSDAEEAADASAAQQPEWSEIRQTQAVIRYAATICPDFHAWRHLTWPVPPERSFIKTDDESIAKLRAAADSFARILQETPEEAPDRADLETWRLASLANDAEAQGEAERFAQRLIKENPGHYRAVIWATERGYNFDRASVRAALTKLAKEADADLAAVIGAVNLTVLDAEHSSARALLEECRPRFVAAKAESLWRFLMVQVLANLAQDDAVKMLLEEENDAVFRLKSEAAVRKIRAWQSRDAGPVADLLVRAYEETDSAEALFDAAEACLHADRPQWVIDRAEKLLRSFNTAGVVRMVVQSAWQVGQTALCLKLLSEHHDVFRGRVPPPDLRRLEVACLRREGRLAEAAELATRLVAENDQPENAFERFQTQLALGDLQGCAHTARLILGAEGVAPLHLLQMARVLALVERSLAVDLWEEAIQRGPLDDDSILLAVDVAHRLGLEKGTLMHDFHRIAMSGHPAIRAAPFDEIVEKMRRQRQVQEKANQDYSAGAAPVHVISAMAGWPMAAIYHTQLEQNARAESPLRQSPVMVRHGSRPLDQEIVLETGTLVADVTAIMLAEQIEILNLVERHLGPVFISSWLPRSLNLQRERAEPHDAATDQAQDGVLNLVKDKRISVAPIPWPLLERADAFGRQMGPVWCAWLERMKEKDGVIVDFVPLTSNDGKSQIVAIPQQERSRIISLGELLEGLRSAGVLTTVDLETAAARIGDAQVRGENVDFPEGRFVFLEQGIAEQLFRAGMLARICEHCRVEIGEAAHLFLKSDVAAARTRVELAEWLLRLLDRVQRGIQDNRYKTFTHGLEESTAKGLEEDIDFRCMHDLVPAQSEGGRAVWCDDRFINAHFRTEAGPLVSTMEVLGDLRRRGVLSEDQYFGKLLDLRRMGIRHLTLSSDEILYHLRSARIEGDRVEETPGLATLRMATAAALRDTERIQVPPAGHFSPDSPGEFQWLMDLREAVSEAILETWKEEETPIAVARSEWLFESVHFDMEALLDLFRPEARAGGMPPFFADVLRLFLVGVGLPHAPFGAPDSADSKRRIFYRWLYFRVVAPVLRTNPELEAALGKDLARAIDSYGEPVKNAPAVRRLVAFQMLGVYHDLPQAMCDFIAPSQLLQDEFRARGGEKAVVVANHLFPFRDFWHGAAEAVNGREAIIKTFDGVDCALAPGIREEFGHVVLLTTPLAESAVPISSELLPLLYDDLGLLRRYLNQHPELFDLPRDQQKDAIEKIVATPDLVERTEVAREYSRRSAEHFYRDLQVKLARGFALQQDDLMPPAVNSLAQHIRIDVSGSIDWNSSARRLVEDEGLAETIFRLGGLPIRLPEAALFAARQLDDAEFEKLLSSLGSRMLTPISHLHCFHLIADRAARSPAWLSRAVAARDLLLTKQTRIEKFPGFIAILRWCFEDLRQRMETQEWHSWVIIACAWIHASRIHNIQLESGVQAEEVESRFSQLLAAAPILLDQRRIEIRDDVAHANHVNWPIFLTRGLGDVIMSVRTDAGRALAPDPKALLQAFGTQSEWPATLMDLIAETETRANALTSFLGGPWIAPVNALFPEQIINERLGSNPRTLALEQLEHIEIDLMDHRAWTYLNVIVRDAPFYTEDAHRIDHLLRRVELNRLLETQGEEGLRGIRFVCAQTRHLGSDETRQRFERELLACSAFCQKVREERKGPGSDNDAFERIAWHLLESAFLLTARHTRPEEPSPFWKLTAEMIHICPALGTILRRRLGGRVPPLPLALARGAWPLFLTLRAAP